MIKVTNKNINWYVIFLIAFFITEAVYKYLSYYLDLSEVRISGIVKFFFQIIMVYSLIINYKKIKTEILMLISIITFYFLGQLALNDAPKLISQLEQLNKSLFVIIFLLYFNVITLSVKQKKVALKAYEILVIFNSILCVIGLFTNYHFFETYNRGFRFGYDGLILKQSYATYFYICALFYFADQFKIYKTKSILKFMLVCFASILVGTKGALLGLLFVLIYLVIKNKLYYNIKCISLFVLALIIGFFYKEEIIERITITYGLLIDIYKDKGLITMLFSFRNEILTEQLIPYIKSNWNFINYLFGGLGNVNVRSGLDVFDLMYYFGIIGAVFYVILFIKSFGIQPLRYRSYCFLLIIFTVAALGGNYFYNSSLAVSLCAIKFYLESLNESKHH